MTQNLNDYFRLVDLAKSVTTTSDLNALRGRFRDVSKQIRELSSTLAKPDVNITDVIGKIQTLKNEQRQLSTKMEESGDVDRSAIKQRILETRKNILDSAHRHDWNELVGYFKTNPVALTALIQQANYEQQDPVKVLKVLPFRGRISGPMPSRFNYEVELANGKKVSYKSVGKVLKSLDQYNKEIKNAAVTYDVLGRNIERGVSIDGVRVTKVNRVPKA